jgi:hypothetical protein
MEAVIKALVAAPIANVVILFALMFLGIAIVGNVHNKISPGRNGRIVAGVLGSILLIAGLVIGLPTKIQRFNEAKPPTTPAQVLPIPTGQSDIPRGGAPRGTPSGGSGGTAPGRGGGTVTPIAPAQSPKGGTVTPIAPAQSPKTAPIPRGAWEGAKAVGIGWGDFKQVFSGGNGVIYAIAADGTLNWYRHNGYATGAGLETPGAWEGAKNVGHGWGDFKQGDAAFESPWSVHSQMATRRRVGSCIPMQSMTFS